METANPNASGLETVTPRTKHQGENHHTLHPSLLSSPELQKEGSPPNKQIQKDEATKLANGAYVDRKEVSQASRSSGHDAANRQTNHFHVPTTTSTSQNRDHVYTSDSIAAPAVPAHAMVSTLAPVPDPISSTAGMVLSDATCKPKATTLSNFSSKLKAKGHDPYRRRLRITNSLDAFPASGACIPMVYHEHFYFIADCLLREIEAHRSPVAKASAPDTDLFLVGSGPADAKPSIVVTCDSRLLSHVEALICVERIQNQHNLVLHKKSGLSSSRKWQYPKNYCGNGPCYYLYVRTPETTRVKFGGIMVQCHTIFEADASNTLWCGSKIVQTQTSARATLSCILKIDGHTYGLTAAHSFESYKVSTIRVHEDGAFTLSDCSDGALLIPDLATQQIASQDLDWALVKMSESFSAIANANISPLGITATKHPGNERDILILSSAMNVPYMGVLLCGGTLSGAGVDGSGDVTYWNVELEDDEALQTGDSGSLVIDALTRKVYGYVVARNSYGLIQVIPMHAALSQIKQFMNSKSISLLRSPELTGEQELWNEKRGESQIWSQEDSLEDNDESRLDTRSKSPGEASEPNYVTTLSEINKHGNFYYHQSKFDEAELFYKQALEGKEKALGTQHISTLQTVSNLGCIYSKQGKLSLAEKMFSRALEGSEAAVGPKHRTTLNIVNNLGNLYRSQGKLAEARNMLWRALVGKEKAFGPEHSSTLDTINNLGLVFSDQGKLEEADRNYMLTVNIKQRILGMMNTSTLITYNNQGNLYWKQGMLIRAETMYSRALQGIEKALGPKHMLTLIVMKNLAACHQAQGKLDQASLTRQRMENVGGLKGE